MSGSLSIERKSFMSLFLAGALFFSGSLFAGDAQKSQELAKSWTANLTNGGAWLLSQQNKDGGFGPSLNPRVQGSSDVGISSFALYALARLPKEARSSEAMKAGLEKGVKFLLKNQQKNGSFTDPRDPRLLNYKTSVGVLALVALDRARFDAPIKKAVGYIKSQQVVDVKDLGYGGIGYGSRDTNPDVSNLQFALEAIHEAGESTGSSTYARVQSFLRKVQNLKGGGKQKIGEKDGKPIFRKTTGDGGFFYRIIDTRGPVETLDDGAHVFSSYGSMTYAGLKSLLYAQVDKKDPRVKAAFDWIQKNFTVSENPGMATKKDPKAGLQGLFYYYHTMAKALSVYGQAELTDSRGVKHNWAAELGKKIASLQSKSGSWKNAEDRWMESIEALSTSYALVALTVCQEGLQSRD